MAEMLWCVSRGAQASPVDAGMVADCQQVTAKDGQAHQAHPISDAGVWVRFLAEGQGQDAPTGHWHFSSAGDKTILLALANWLVNCLAP